MRILKDKRGIALETAILFMIVIFALCFVVMSLALRGTSDVKLDGDLLLLRVELDQIGEDFLESVKSGEEFDKHYENYTYEVNNSTLTVKRLSADTVVLYVQAELVGEQVDIKCWRYSQP